MTTLGSQLVPEYLENEKEHRRQIARAVNQTKTGKINATLDVTLTPSVTSTTIYDNRISYNSALVPAMPMTANAAAALAAGIYVDSVLDKIGTTPSSAVIRHASNVATDQTIRFLIIG